jgi:hypothetical protein
MVVSGLLAFILRDAEPDVIGRSRPFYAVILESVAGSIREEDLGG